jgi:exosortase
MVRGCDGLMARRSSITLLAAIAAAIVLYAPVLAGLVRQWWIEPASSHGLLLVGVAVLLVHRRRAQLRALPLEPRNAGLALVGTGLLIFATGTITGDVFILRASLPFVIAGVVLVLGGSQHLRLIVAPLGLLVLAIPLPAVVVTQATMPLQLIASQVAASVLEACQVAVVRHGNLLMLDRVTLEVADVCSGLRSLVSLVSVTAVCAAFFSISTPRVVLLIAAAIPVAILGNGLRVAATGLLSTWIGEAAARGFLHDLTGYAAFVLMFGMMVVIQILSRPEPKVPATVGV